MVPEIVSSESGKYTLEIEPGTVGSVLKVEYDTDGDGTLDEIAPSFIELPMLTKPISGQYFSSKSVSSITGKVVGGSCQLPIPSDQGDIVVTIEAVNGCYTDEAIVDELGDYAFTDIPPINYNISVYHPDPTIDEAFDAEFVSVISGPVSHDFVYYSPLILEMSDVAIAHEDASGGSINDVDGLNEYIVLSLIHI